MPASILLAGLSILVVAAVVIFLANRWHRPGFGDLTFRNAPLSRRAGTEVTVVTWNIGYGALGARADFLVDGGKHLRVLTGPEIQDATRRIADDLTAKDADIILVQEAAEASFLTRGVNVKARLVGAMTTYSHVFWPDFSTVMVPQPLRFRHGMLSFVRDHVDGCGVWDLPQDPQLYCGFLKKYYAALVVRQPIEGSTAQWVFVNLHLSAFDDQAQVRKAQISALFDLAMAEHRKGNHVILGGDWNMRISLAEFPHSTAPKHLFWVHDFPMELLPEGWQFVVDETVPTVRTLHKPYVRGENYTMIIDGFAVSPNVEVLQVQGLDRGFAYTDHHAVVARFRAR